MEAYEYRAAVEAVRQLYKLQLMDYELCQVLIARAGEMDSEIRSLDEIFAAADRAWRDHLELAYGAEDSGHGPDERDQDGEQQEALEAE